MKRLDAPPTGFQKAKAGSTWMGPQCAACGTRPNWRDGWLEGCHCSVRAARSEASADALDTVGDNGVITLPPIPSTEAELRTGLEDIYSLSRQSTMEHLRFAWDCGRWISNALEVARSNGWKVADLVKGMREDEAIPFRWAYSTVAAYRQLGREDWNDVAKCGSVRKALEWIRAKNRTPQEAKRMAERKAGTRNRDHVYRDRMLILERQNDSLSKRNRALEERLRVLETAADPSAVEDLEAAVRDHAEAERQAHGMTAAAEAKADLWERRVARVEREAAHLRRQVSKLRGDPLTAVVNGPEHPGSPGSVPEVTANGNGNGGGDTGLWPPGVAA